MKPVVVTSSARSDIDNAWLFYDQQEEGVGDYFESVIWSDIESLARFHGIHRCCSGYHRMTASVFPYAIYYREQPGRIEVVAILDMRRDPSWLRRQLRQR